MSSERLDRAVQAMWRASADVLREVARIDEHRLWETEGTSMAQWLGARYNVTYSTASEWVRVARAFRSLPAIARAYQEGRLSWDQLRPLTKFATPDTDEALAKDAPEWSAGWLWQESRRYEQVRERDAVEARRRRCFRKWWNEDTTELYFEGMLPAEEGASFERAIDARAQQVVVADDPIEPGEARSADALHELVTGCGAGEAAPATLVVHADASVLTGEEPEQGPWLAETEAGIRVCSEAVRRLACDARIEWVLERGGRSVGMGRRGRVVNGQIGRILRHRDRTCRFPGCERKKWLKGHHIKHWAHGGRTDLDNLVLLCHAHHQRIHEGGWSARGDPVRGLRFHDPTGRPLRSFAESEVLLRAG